PVAKPQDVEATLAELLTLIQDAPLLSTQDVQARLPAFAPVVRQAMALLHDQTTHVPAIETALEHGPTRAASPDSSVRSGASSSPSGSAVSSSTTSTSITSSSRRTMDQYRRGSVGSHNTSTLTQPCPMDETATMGGFVRMRLSGREWRMKTWYCMLYKHNIYWYASKKDALTAKNLRGKLRVLQAAVSNGAGVIHTYPHAFTFEAKNGQVYFCSAPTHSEQQRWIDEINHAAKQYAEYIAQTAALPEAATRRSSTADDCDNADHVVLHTRELDRETETRKTKMVGLSTTSGVAAGAIVGSVVPVLGTLIGGVVGGVLSHKSAMSTRSLRVEAALRRKIKYEELLEQDSSCAACGLEFALLGRHRHYCGSCFQAFCRPHCAKEVVLATSGEPQLVKVCDGCMHRQHFITFMMTMTSRALALIRTETNAFASLNKYKPLDPLVVDHQLQELELIVSSPANYTVLNVLCLLKKHLENPWMFARVLCVLIPLCESDVNGMDAYWVQFLGLFVPLVRISDKLEDAELRRSETHGQGNASEVTLLLFPPLFLYVRLIMAMCRRSTHFALRTVWECLAIFDDARNRNDTSCTNHTLLLIYLVSSFNGNSELVANLWLKDSPETQARAIVAILDDFMELHLLTRDELPDMLCMTWLAARNSHQIAALHDLILQMLVVTSPRELLDLLSPIPAEATDYRDVLVTDDVERSCQSKQDEQELASQREQAFNDEAVFVDNMTSLADHLRLVTPVSERKNVLPGLLRDLQVSLTETSLPSQVYIPLCSAALEGTTTILRVVPNEGKVFSTRSRAPTMMVFEAIVHSKPEKPRREDDGNDSDDTSDSSTPTAPHEKVTLEKLLNLRSSRSLARTESTMLDVMLCGLTDPSSETLQRPHAASSCSVESDEGVPQDLLIEEARDLYGDSTAAANSVAEQEKEAKAETWAECIERVRQTSDLSHLPGWTLVSVIAKSFDDLRQEVFAMQLMDCLDRIFRVNKLDLYLRPYRILCTGANVGLIETLTDSISVDGAKKKYGSLANYFTHFFGQPYSPEYIAAQHAFVSSMAAYSIYCYLFQIKDRHNGNVMLDREGHLLHIDFGFMFGTAPGGAFSLEDAPFKLTLEMVDIMGGLHSQGFETFKRLLLEGFMATRREYIKLLSLVHLTLTDSSFPCFQHQTPDRVLRRFRQRLFLDEHDDGAVSSKVLALVERSLNNWGMRQYDNFQHASNGIMP
ncbi:TPA: hypothetical protein N0F65_006842, partial [Lagenidium giganteum]